MSFFAELKQRRVVRVATVYLVVAWVAVQAASIALPAFDAPPWVLRFTILLFALGFPLALLLAWALDLTPEGVRLVPSKVGNKRMIFISLGLVALALGWYFYGQPAIRAARDTPERSIAVLPFVNMSGNPSNDYFSDGLAETTLDMLAQVPDLKVIARTSSFQFRGKNSDMREIGKALGAAHLLEGSVQQAGDTVRITVQLIRAKDGSHLWSKRYDRRVNDVFKIQDEIATSVVDALALQLPESAQKRMVRKRTDNVGAYDAYLQGNALLARRDVGQMRDALKHFERAIALDPNYARAYVGAHNATHLLNLYGGVTEADQARADEYLKRALALAPDLGEAHIAKGVSLENAGKPEAAIAEYRRGVELAPAYATGWQWMGELEAWAFGRFDLALPMMRRAVDLDPLSPVIRSTYLFVLGHSGAVDEAIAGMDKLIAQHPNIARNHDDRASVLQAKGDFVAMMRDYAKQDALDPNAYGFRTHRCHSLMDFGAIDAAEACMRPLAAQAPEATNVRIAQARIAYLQGDIDSAVSFFPKDAHSGASRYLASLLVAAGDMKGALDIYRGWIPKLLDGSQAAPRVGEAGDALQAGVALMHNGQQARGRALVEGAMAALADRPRAVAIAPLMWWDVVGNEVLGRRDAAFAALQAGIDEGYVQQMAELDAHPLLAQLRKDPRYARITEPARAKAQAQIDAARAAGLL